MTPQRAIMVIGFFGLICMIAYLFSTIQKWYGVEDTILRGKYDLVVPMDYGTLRRKAGSKILPNAGEACIREAAKLVVSGKAEMISWAETDKFGTPIEEIVSEKLRLITEFGLDKNSVSVMVHHVVNSVTEIEAIVQANPEAKRIIVVSDWRHTRRLQRIWRHFFKGELAFRSVNTDWNEDHASWFCRANWRRLVSDVTADIAFRIFGVERMRGIAHTNIVLPPNNSSS